MPMNDEIQRVSKLDAARRQLREAILLYFERRDAVAIHTLASAAHQVLADLGERKGGAGILKNPKYIRPEKKEELLRILNEAQNFFKHADRDPDTTFEFRVASTPLFLFDAVEMWGELTGSFFREALVYRIWYFFAHPQIIAQEQVQAILEPWRQVIDVNDFEGIRYAIEHADLGT
jgi:hypothetical protein